MRKVIIKRDDLLTKIRTNREAHRDLFLKAQIGYRAAIIQELDTMLNDARENRSIRRDITLPEPIDHTKDYDRIIAMLEMCARDEVELEDHEFDQYVLDNWSWKELAVFTNSSYLRR